MYSLTIIGLKPKQLLALLDVVPPQATIKVERPNGPTIEKAGKQVGVRINGDTIIGLNPNKSPRAGTSMAAACLALEKLETKHGPGNVNRDELTEAVAKKDDKPGNTITRALKHGYILAG